MTVSAHGVPGATEDGCGDGCDVCRQGRRWLHSQRVMLTISRPWQEHGRTRQQLYVDTATAGSHTDASCTVAAPGSGWSCCSATVAGSPLGQQG